MFIELEHALAEQDFRTAMEDMADSYMASIGEEDSISEMLLQDMNTEGEK